MTFEPRLRMYVLDNVLVKSVQPLVILADVHLSAVLGPISMDRRTRRSNTLP